MTLNLADLGIIDANGRFQDRHLRTYIDTLCMSVHEAVNQLTAEVKKPGIVVNQQELAGAVGAIEQSFDGEVQTLLIELSRAKRQVEARIETLSAPPDPMVSLSANELTRATSLQSHFAGRTPAQLRQTAEQAVATGDSVTVAALWAVVERGTGSTQGEGESPAQQRALTEIRKLLEPALPQPSAEQRRRLQAAQQEVERLEQAHAWTTSRTQLRERQRARYLNEGRRHLGKGQNNPRIMEAARTSQ